MTEKSDREFGAVKCCARCGTVVVRLMPGSQVREGTEMVCRMCLAYEPQNDAPDFMQKLFGKFGKR